MAKVQKNFWHADYINLKENRRLLQENGFIEV